MKDLNTPIRGNLNYTAPAYLLKYQKQYRENPNSRVFAPLAEAYRKLGMYREALDVLKKGLKIHPQFILGHISFAQCAYDQKKYNECINYLLVFKDKYIENIKLQMLIAKSSIEVGKWELAKEALDKLSECGVKKDWLKGYWDRIPNEIINKQNKKQKKSFTETANEINSHNDEVSKWETLNLSGRPSRVEQFKATEIKTTEKKLSEKDSNSKNTIPLVIDSEEKTKPKNIKKELKKGSAPNGSPMITFTLAELYTAQGHYKKALEVLYKFAEIGHDGPKLQEKIKEILLLQKASHMPDPSSFIIDSEEETNDNFLVVEDEADDAEIDRDVSYQKEQFEIDEDDEISSSLKIIDEEEEGHDELLAAVAQTQSSIGIDDSVLRYEMDGLEKAYDLFLEKIKIRAIKKLGSAS